MTNLDSVYGKVLDVGFGIGGSLPFLIDAVGNEGRIDGIEISSETIVNTQNKIRKSDWTNIQIIEFSAQSADLNGFFDGALMIAAPDVYASESALKTIPPHLKDGSR